VYVGFFDESGTLEAGGYICLAGFVIREEKLPAFNDGWNAALARHGAPFLHTTDLVNFKREFKQWTPERRNALMADLMEVIHGAGRILAVGAVMSIEDYNKFSQKDRDRMHGPFFPLFQEVVRGAALEAYFEGPGTQVRMVYSQQQEFGPDATKLAEILQRLDRHRRIGPLTLANMRDVPMLQAADLLAYELRRYYSNLRNAPHVPMRWPLLQILLQQRVLGIRFIKLLPRWYMWLQLRPRWVFYPAMNVLTALVAIPAYFDMRRFGWLMRAPELPTNYERIVQELEAKENGDG
jgi:hypothetical protein